jgi:hypothetical protein
MNRHGNLRLATQGTNNPKETIGCTEIRGWTDVPEKALTQRLEGGAGAT